MDPFAGPMDDAALDPLVVEASAALVAKLEATSRVGYVRVSAETDHVTGAKIGLALRPLAAVSMQPGTPGVVTVGLNAKSADSVLEILRDLAS